MATIAEITRYIDGLKPGKTTSCRTEQYFVVARPPQEGNAYSVECGWVVPERNDDDYLSFGGNSEFKSRDLRPWVGRRLFAATSSEAAEIFQRWLAQVSQRHVV